MDIDPKASKTVARAARNALRELWARRDRPETLHPTERRMLDLLEMHEEFRGVWEGDEPPEGENPFLHVSLHRMVDRQIDDDDPAGTRAAYERLVAGGVDEHEARHRIMEIWVIEVAQRLEQGEAVDIEGYRKKLDEIRP